MTDPIDIPERVATFERPIEHERRKKRRDSKRASAKKRRQREAAFAALQPPPRTVADSLIDFGTWLAKPIAPLLAWLAMDLRYAGEDIPPRALEIWTKMARAAGWMCASMPARKWR